MKKIISLLSVFALILCLSVSAFAVSDNTPPSPPSDGGPGGPPAQSTSDLNYIGATQILSEDAQSGMTYESSTPDESALLINTQDKVQIDKPTVTKTGDSNGGDNCNFYGLNAAVLAMGGTNTVINGGEITSSANGANGVFCYGGNGGSNGAKGDGTTVTISDTKIKTTGDSSGGIMTTGGGTTYANNLNVETSGRSSAPIRTDRGGGTVVVSGGTYTSNGLGSPAIYSTASIVAENANLVSNLSEGVCIEGKNSITLENSNLTANNTKTNGNATFLDTVMIYQSMSGDSNEGTSEFNMSGGTLTSKSGHVFHVTNTKAVINLSDVEIINDDSEDILLSVCDDGWSGASNVATLNATSQFLHGGILVGDNSTLNLTLGTGTVFEGYIDGNIKNASGKTISSEVGDVTLTLNGGKLVLTRDTYVKTFIGDTSNVAFNGYTLYVDGDALSESDSEISEQPSKEEESTVIEEEADEEEQVSEEVTEEIPEQTNNHVKLLIGIAATLAVILIIVLVIINKKDKDDIQDEE